MSKTPRSGDDVQTHRPSYVAPALEKGFNVVELLARSPQGLTASEIASGLGLTISEIFRIIMVMERRPVADEGHRRQIPGHPVNA